jgi:hypothetical protein
MVFSFPKSQLTVQKFKLYFLMQDFWQLSFCKVDRTISCEIFFSTYQISLAMTSSHIVAMPPTFMKTTDPPFPIFLNPK